MHICTCSFAGPLTAVSLHCLVPRPCQCSSWTPSSGSVAAASQGQSTPLPVYTGETENERRWGHHMREIISTHCTTWLYSSIFCQPTMKTSLSALVHVVSRTFRGLVVSRQCIVPSLSPWLCRLLNWDTYVHVCVTVAALCSQGDTQVHDGSYLHDSVKGCPKVARLCSGLGLCAAD